MTASLAGHKEHRYRGGIADWLIEHVCLALCLGSDIEAADTEFPMHRAMHRRDVTREGQLPDATSYVKCERVKIGAESGGDGCHGGRVEPAAQKQSDGNVRHELSRHSLLYQSPAFSRSVLERDIRVDGRRGPVAMDTRGSVAERK